jgi:hypothetical protein
MARSNNYLADAHKSAQEDGGCAYGSRQQAHTPAQCGSADHNDGERRRAWDRARGTERVGQTECVGQTEYGSAID